MPLLGLWLLLQAGGAPPGCPVAHQIHVSTSPTSITPKPSFLGSGPPASVSEWSRVCVLALRNFQTLMGKLLAFGSLGHFCGLEIFFETESH